MNGTSCSIETFDCTVGPDVSVPSHLADRVRLHRECIGPTTHIDVRGLAFVDWPTLLQRAGLTGGRAPVFTKLDIEGFEYSVLSSMVAAMTRDAANGGGGPRSAAQLPLQIAFELHFRTNPGSRTLPWARRTVQVCGAQGCVSTPPGRNRVMPARCQTAEAPHAHMCV